MARATKRLAVDSEAEFEIAARSANAAVEAANASVSQTEISERSLQSLVRPWITAGEYGWEEDDGSDFLSRLPLVTLEDGYDNFALKVSAKLQNVGPGIALIDAGKSWFLGWSQSNDPDEIKPFVNLFTETPVVPSQSTFYVVGQASPSSASWSNLTPEKFAYPRTGMSGIKGLFIMAVAYTDAGGNNPVTAEIHVVVGANRACRIFKIRYLVTDSEEELAEVIVGSPGSAI